MRGRTILAAHFDVIVEGRYFYRKYRGALMLFSKWLRFWGCGRFFRAKITSKGIILIIWDRELFYKFME